jgi:penicillin-binding protein 1A
MAAETPKKKKKGEASSRKSGIYKAIVAALWATFVIVLLAIPLYIYSVSINFMGLYGGMPGFKMLENPENDVSSELYSSDNILLGKYFRENRVMATFDELSPNLVNSLVAVEDERFEEHSGIDGRGLMRVAVKSILLGQNAGGGSTLSQQLAKNLFNLRTEERYEGKLYGINSKLDMLFKKTKEWILAVRLEQSYTKKEILTMYLNTADFGSNAFGIKVASQTFFNKSPIELDVHEAALLAGIVQAPSRHSPIRNPESATIRRNVVINQMTKAGFLSSTEADTIKLRPLGLEYNVENHNQGPAPYFRSVIKDFLHSWTREHGYDLYEDGLKIYTTIDSRMQSHAEEVVGEHMASLQKKFDEEWKGQNPWIDEKNREMKGYIEEEIKKTDFYRSLSRKYGKNADSIQIALNKKRPMRIFSYKGEVDTLISHMDSMRHYKRFLHTGFMAMDPYTGAIRAWVGGVNHKHFKFDHVKQGRRQPGSTFKSFVYATAIENGYSPCYSVYDVPQSYPTGGDPPTWSPQNSDGKFTGQPMTMREALARSVNSVTANIMYKVRPENVVALAKRMGIQSHLEPVLSLALGVDDVSVYELVGAYSTFVNKGVYTEPYYITRIEDKNGNVLYEPHPKTVEALSEETAYLMLHMLKGSTEIEGGAGMGLSRELRYNIEIGAKTGTTQNGSDGWFMGVTPQLVAGAWVGGDARSIRFKSWYSGQGSRTARPIWDKFMARIYNDPELGFSKTTFDAPESPVNVELNCNKYNQQPLDTDTDDMLTQQNDSLESKPRKPINPNEIF